MKRVFLIILSILLCILAFAAEPVKWRISVKMADETHGTLTVRAVIEQGWHMYGTQMPENGPKATTFAFSGCTGVKFTSDVIAQRPAGIHEDPLFGQTLSWWDSSVNFTRKFELTDKDNAKITVNVSYMGCNNQSCLPPKTVSLTYNFNKQ